VNAVEAQSKECQTFPHKEHLRMAYQNKRNSKLFELTSWNMVIVYVERDLEKNC
jgi:hypothetical protein